MNWAERVQAAPLVLSVLEDKAEFDHEISIFGRTLWTWLGGAALLLLLSQTVLLEWALAPLRLGPPPARPGPFLLFLPCDCCRLALRPGIRMRR